MDFEEARQKKMDGTHEDSFTYFVEDDIRGIKFKQAPLLSIPLNKIGIYSSLTYLCLRKCGLSKLNEDIFSIFRRMNWLDIRDNKLTEFPRVVDHDHLESILLGGNSIEKLPIELGSFPRLVSLQVTGNPLLYPDSEALERYGVDLVSFLKLCWKNQTEKPTTKPAPAGKDKKKASVKRNDDLLRVKQFRNVTSIIVEKMNSLDPVDQLLASRVIKKMRDIDSKLQRSKNDEVLKAWRDFFQIKGSTGQRTARCPPYDVSQECMTMPNRRDLRSGIDQGRKKINRVAAASRTPVNLTDEFRKLDERLDHMKSWKPTLDPSADKASMLSELRDMQDIFNKIKHYKTSHLI